MNTIEKTENDYWEEPGYSTQLVKRCHELRKVPIDKFTIEDLRIMIGQQFSLPILIPIALEKFADDLFVAGDFYEGDLLNCVLLINTEYWNAHEFYWLKLNALIKNRRDEIVLKKIDLARFDQCQFGKANK